jgi:UDPglucose 6-dehydrogenase
MRVAMIGAGYVGLVSGACFADFGRLVCCVDTDETKIAALEGGRMPIYEPGLEALVETNVRAKRLTFTGDLKAAVGAAEAVFIAVGTRRGAATATPIFPMSIRQRATSPGRSPAIRSSSPNGR